MGDSTGVLVSLGGGISSGGKKYQESNIGGSDNTGDGGTTVGGWNRTSLDPPWSGLRLHLSGDKFLRWARKLGMQGVGVIRVRMDMGDKEVTKQDLVAKVVMEVLGRLLGDMVVMSWRCLRS
ncbi:hypothetical protein Tco_1219231 [Tanacetum coccineum]